MLLHSGARVVAIASHSTAAWGFCLGKGIPATLQPHCGFDRYFSVASTSSLPPPTPTHNVAAQRFELKFGPDANALLAYRIIPPLETGPGTPSAPVMDIWQTYTPPAARGKGAARLLSDAAFAYAEGAGMPIRPTCGYIRDTYMPAQKGEASKWVMNEDTDLLQLR